MKLLDLVISRRVIFSLVLVSGVLCTISAETASAQGRRDHLTKEEIEIVRDVQEIDLRMIVFIRAIQRRFITLDGGAGKLTEIEQKKLTKEEEMWGELPAGSQTELLSDIDEIIDEAISKIEDVAERDAKSDLFPFAIHILADNCSVINSRLESFSDKNPGPRDTALINSSVSNCRDIIDAAGKVPRPDEKLMKKRIKKS